MQSTFVKSVRFTGKEHVQFNKPILPVLPPYLNNVLVQTTVTTYPLSESTLISEVPGVIIIISFL